MADIELARRFLAGKYQDAGLPHVAAAVLAGISPLGQGTYVAAVAVALADVPAGHVLVPVEDMERIMKVLRFAAHPERSPHADAIERHLAAKGAQP